MCSAIQSFLSNARFGHLRENHLRVVLALKHYDTGMLFRLCIEIFPPVILLIPLLMIKALQQLSIFHANFLKKRNARH
jgi:hypothetical protein